MHLHARKWTGNLNLHLHFSRKHMISRLVLTWNLPFIKQCWRLFRHQQFICQKHNQFFSCCKNGGHARIQKLSKSQRSGAGNYETFLNQHFLSEVLYFLKKFSKAFSRAFFQLVGSRLQVQVRLWSSRALFWGLRAAHSTLNLSTS